MISQIWFFLSHIYLYLNPLIGMFGNWIYITLFVLIFMETGLVVFAFLPGESLIFFSSTLAAITGSALDIRILIPVFFFAALIGDTVNYEIGRNLHRFKFFQRFMQTKRFRQAHAFFEQHGGKTVMFGRFVPLIRTFIPLISGSAGMKYQQFCFYNFLGVLIWVAVGSSLGYFFGQLDFVQEHFSLVFLAVLGFGLISSILMAIYRLLRKKTLAN
ncbi:VTT domain-containing protein [Liquorilactobacillus vini]|nr:VTT domain-containing protein [Liquorilactobacillus vini]